MAAKTPWSKSSVPSDRIKPSQSQTAPSKRKGGGAAQPTKSKAIIQLESLLRNIREYTGREKDPKGGCFCLAADHPLSQYTPICRTCGLILCSLNQPYWTCPHCNTGLLATPAAREAIIARLESQIADTAAKEAEEQQRAEEEARQAAGAFPTLSGTPSTASLRPSTNEPHKVLSLNSKTKKVIVSYNSTPATSRPASRADVENKEEVVRRVPPPPNEVSYARRAPDPARPWANLSIDPIIYLPSPSAPSGSSGSSSSRRKKGKQQPTNNETAS
ncbi:hypothetical protein EYR40_009158 [Pleurotus pulmonarius]|nr:hypothetical protein EYR40_009158 [Pleurotus pulmonarius]